MRWLRSTTIVTVSLTFATTASAQATPFLFTVVPMGARTPSAFGYYELGYGERTFEPVAGERLEHAFGIHANLGSSVSVLARTGVATLGNATRVSPRAEVAVTRRVGRTLQLAGGLGYAREYSQTDVMLARVGVGRATSRSIVHGNVLFEKPFSGDRDAVDLITTFAAGRKLGTAVTMSVEAVGQDLEGFWDPAEKDGGARLMIGPSVAIAPPGAKWQLVLGGGPIVRATSSTFRSGADRPLPTRNGYVIRSAIGFGW